MTKVSFPLIILTVLFHEAYSCGKDSYLDQFRSEKTDHRKPELNSKCLDEYN
jgi:hypothetical protein